MLAFITISTVLYHRLSSRLDRAIEAGPFQHTLSYFAAPEILSLGDPSPTAELGTALKNTVVVHAGQSEIRFKNGRVSSIVDLVNRRSLVQTEIPPQIISDMSAEGRAKRLVLKFSDFPPRC